MSWYYNVTISETKPDNPEMGRVWILPALSQAYIYLGTEWVTFAGSGAIGSYTAGTYYMTVLIQEIEPPQTVGQIWIKISINTAYIFLDEWLVILGA